MRRIVFTLSLACLVAAAGMMVAFLVKQFRERPRRNAEKEAAGQDAGIAIAGLSSAPRGTLMDQQGSMTIESQRQSAGHGMRFYDGNVGIFLPPMTIDCQHVQREADGLAGSVRLVRLAGYGGVVIRGVAPFSMLKADNFTFDNRGHHVPMVDGLLTLAGEVQVEGPDGLKKYRLCVIALNGLATNRLGSGARIVKARSLLDDFAENQTTLRKLALLDDVTAVYSDDELPPEANYLLAMKLLERHLTWHGGKAEGGRRKAESVPLSSFILHPSSFFPEAHTGETWMRESAETVSYWRLGERLHVDVLRAEKLLDPLRRPLWVRILVDALRAEKLLGLSGADATDSERRYAWLADIQRNNTILRVIVQQSYPPHAAASVTLDVRNADRVTLKIYRVGNNGPAWVNVIRREGRDFIYADGKAAGPRSAGEAPLSDTTAQGPKKLGELMENPIREWSVAADMLPQNDDLAAKRQAPEGETSWRANRKVAIAAGDLAKPGYYILAVTANGETAYAPLRVK